MLAATCRYYTRWVTNKVVAWVAELEILMNISHFQPQAVHSALSHGVMSHCTYLSRTCPDIGPLLLPLEDALCLKLIPSLTNQEAPNDTIRDLFALPCRHGGLGIPVPE